MWRQLLSADTHEPFAHSAATIGNGENQAEVTRPGAQRWAPGAPTHGQQADDGGGAEHGGSQGDQPARIGLPRHLPPRLQQAAARLQVPPTCRHVAAQWRIDPWCAAACAAPLIAACNALADGTRRASSSL